MLPPQALPPLADESQVFSAWSWSPDGKKIAGFQQARDGVFTGISVYSVESKQFEKLTDFGVDPVWLSDGRRLLFHHRGRLHLVDSRTHETREVLSVEPADVGGKGFAVSNDDRAIYFSEVTTEADVWLLSMK